MEKGIYCAGDNEKRGNKRTTCIDGARWHNTKNDRERI